MISWRWAIRDFGLWVAVLIAYAWFTVCVERQSLDMGLYIISLAGFVCGYINAAREANRGRK